jgi:hypothetical protein
MIALNRLTSFTSLESRQTMKFKFSILTLALLACLTVLCPRYLPYRAAERGSKETYTGTIVGIGGRLGGVTRPFTLTIEGHTSDEDTDRFTSILRSDGQDGLLNAIRKQKLGRFSVDGNVGRDINVVREHNTENGRKITIVFERWLEMFEVRYGTRSENYPFTYIEMYIGDNGKGEGTLIPAARIYFEKKEENTIAIENFGIYPARLSNIQLQTK